MNTMRVPILGAAAVAVSLILAACGGSSGSSTTAASSTSAAGGGATVSVKTVGGMKNVLVDRTGHALYASNVEANGTVHCTGSCVAIWKPLTIGTGQPTAASPAVGKLAVVKRPDGTRQVTDGGRLLYTFAQDGAGTLKGNGVTDQFNGQHFTWSAMLAGGKPAPASGAGGSSSSNYGY
jgi:predicted lipoprotein with Yx(FWY)xxD motif